jgi:hypothetical protein
MTDETRPAARRPKPPGSATPSGDRRQERREVTDPRTMRALAHPVRLALVELIGREGELTATRAAELLD